MEVLKTLTGTQLLFPTVAVAAVLICAALVFSFGFRTPVEPVFDKVLLDDRKQKDKKRKTKDKKPSANNVTAENKTETSKKSPKKEKKEEKVKEPTKPKEKPAEVKIKVELKREDNKKVKKIKGVVDEEKPVDYDDGEWEEVPKKEKKKPKSEEKKDSPVKKNKKKRDAEEDQIKADAVNSVLVAEVDVRGAADADTDRVSQELREKINELQRVLKEAELRDNGLLPADTPVPTALKELSSADTFAPAAAEITTEAEKKKPKKDKKKSESGGDAVSSDVKSSGKENIPEPADQDKQAVVFDELGDTWSEAKAPKKSKKKARKD